MVGVGQLLICHQADDPQQKIFLLQGQQKHICLATGAPPSIGLAAACWANHCCWCTSLPACCRAVRRWLSLRQQCPKGWGWLQDVKSRQWRCSAGVPATCRAVWRPAG